MEAFTILLSFLFFYIIFLVFLKKSRIFAPASNYFYLILSILLSLVSTLSLYFSGLIRIFPSLFGIFIIIIFLILYTFSTLHMSEDRIYRKTFRLRDLEFEIEELVRKYKIAKSEEEKKEILKKMKNRIDIIEKIAAQEKKELNKEIWYKEAKEILKGR